MQAAVAQLVPTTEPHPNIFLTTNSLTPFPRDRLDSTEITPRSAVYYRSFILHSTSSFLDRTQLFPPFLVDADVVLGQACACCCYGGFGLRLHSISDLAGRHHDRFVRFGFSRNSLIILVVSTLFLVSCLPCPWISARCRSSGLAPSPSVAFGPWGGANGRGSAT